jgi:DNA-binding beta-propeller fold protein YncE
MRTGFSILFFILSSALWGQAREKVTYQTSEDITSIRYVTTLTSSEGRSNTGFFEKILNFIVGYEPVILNNPVNVMAKGIEDYWIVNQGDKSVLRWLNGKLEKAAAFTKSQNNFTSMVGICQLGDEGLLFTDSRLNKVYLLSYDGRQVREFSKTDSLVRPTGIAYSELTGEILVVETGSHRIAVLSKNGNLMRTIGKRGNGKGEFNFPTYIWIDSSGKIYVVDSMNFRIQVLSPDGNCINSFGKQGDATGCFARPRGIATDSQGNIYVVDALFNSVQIFDISGRLLYYFGTQGRGEYQFWMPSGIFIDKKDYIYISDSYNGRIQIFQFIKKNQK